MWVLHDALEISAAGEQTWLRSLTCSITVTKTCGTHLFGRSSRSETRGCHTLELQQSLHVQASPEILSVRPRTYIGSGRFRVKRHRRQTMTSPTPKTATRSSPAPRERG